MIWRIETEKILNKSNDEWAVVPNHQMHLQNPNIHIHLHATHEHKENYSNLINHNSGNERSSLPSMIRMLVVWGSLDEWESLILKYLIQRNVIAMCSLVAQIILLVKSYTYYNGRTRVIIIQSLNPFFSFLIQLMMN